MNDPHPEKFIPLKVAASVERNRGDLSITVLSQAEMTSTLQGVATKPVAAPAQHAPACEPKVALQRDGERITAIHIECACGRVIELACEY